MPLSIKRVMIFLAAGCSGLLAIQLVPYGRNHTNPPVVAEPSWNNPETRALVKRACFDCHSHETVWDVWYSGVAPASWLVQRDVDSGRRHLNFSDWKNGQRRGEHLDRIEKEVSKGEMPPIQYRLVHLEARLSDVEKRQLIDSLKTTVKK